MKSRSKTLVDPDPFTVAAVYLAGASLVTNLIMIWQHHASDRRAHSATTPRRKRLEQLEGAVEDLQSELRRLNRSISRGSTDADGQFFNVPTRLGQAKLELDPADFGAFTDAMSGALARCGILSRWINVIIEHDPDLAADLGRSVMDSVGDLRDELNEILGGGQPNWRLVEVTNNSLSALAAALDKRLGRTN